MPTPETPITINKGGNQQQLEAIIAEAIVPTFVINSARPVELISVAPGDLGCVEDQQFGAGAPLKVGSSDMVSTFLAYQFLGKSDADRRQEEASIPS